MDYRLNKIIEVLDGRTGNFILSSSAKTRQVPVEGMSNVYNVENTDVSFSAALFLDETADGIGLLASGTGKSAEHAINEMLKEVEEIYR